LAYNNRSAPATQRPKGCVSGRYSALEFTKRFGSYVVSEATIGGTLEMNVRAVNTHAKEDADFEAEVHVKVGYLFNSVVCSATDHALFCVLCGG
jgi:hypothetical protein